MPTGWRSRGYLPHRDQAGLIQHIVLNLRDALPQRYCGPIDPDLQRNWTDTELDKGHGESLLATEANANAVEAALLHHHGSHYALAAWCVMPNHVHIVVEQFPDHPLDRIVQAWKSVSAHAINRASARTGGVWQRELL